MASYLEGKLSRTVCGRMLPYVTHKAGMDGVDKERVQQVVDRHSSSKFNFFKSKRQQTLDTKLAALKARLEGAAPAELQSAAQKAESTARALAGRRDLGRVFAHVDMDAFFANVEMRDCPAYRDVPMAVGGNSMLVGAGPPWVHVVRRARPTTWRARAECARPCPASWPRSCAPAW